MNETPNPQPGGLSQDDLSRHSMNAPQCDKFHVPWMPTMKKAVTDEQFTLLMGICSDIRDEVRAIHAENALLVEIRDLLKAAPARKSGGVKRDDSPREPGLTPPDEAWARFPWPAFTNKFGKRKAISLGESIASGGYGLKDLAWWAENYTPREYKGTISAKDIEFRDCLTMATKWLARQGTSDHVSAPPPAGTKKPEPTELQLANQTDAPQDPPF